MGGKRGHLALMDRYQQHVTCEVQVKESVYDVTMLHDESFFAAAQRKYVYVYDKRGIEVHCLGVRFVFCWFGKGSKAPKVDSR